jgi:tetratricopeptide (TPR) repeat protein
MTPAPSAVSILSRRVRQGNVDPAQVSASEVRTIGLSLFRESDYLRSTPYLLAAYRAAPDDSEVAVRYAIALGEQGRLQDAIDVLLDLRKRNRATPGTPKLLGYYLLWFATRLNEAIAYTEEYLQARPDDEGALMNLACGYAQRSARDGDPGDKEKAIATLRRITKNPVWSKRLDELRHDDFTSFSDDDIRRAKNQA